MRKKSRIFGVQVDSRLVCALHVERCLFVLCSKLEPRGIRKGQAWCQWPGVWVAPHRCTLWGRWPMVAITAAAPKASTQARVRMALTAPAAAHVQQRAWRRRGPVGRLAGVDGGSGACLLGGPACSPHKGHPLRLGVHLAAQQEEHRHLRREVVDRGRRAKAQAAVGHVVKLHDKLHDALVCVERVCAGPWRDERCARHDDRVVQLAGVGHRELLVEAERAALDREDARAQPPD
eukprot:155138-Chlamydomonas_euryale.AAC.2